MRICRQRRSLSTWQPNSGEVLSDRLWPQNEDSSPTSATNWLCDLLSFSNYMGLSFPVCKMGIINNGCGMSSNPWFCDQGWDRGRPVGWTGIPGGGTCNGEEGMGPPPPSLAVPCCFPRPGTVGHRRRQRSPQVPLSHAWSPPPSSLLSTNFFLSWVSQLKWARYY